jgi:hypothetical protein
MKYTKIFSKNNISDKIISYAYFNDIILDFDYIFKIFPETIENHYKDSKIDKINK